MWTKHVGEMYFQKTPLYAFGQLPPIENEIFSPVKTRKVQNTTSKRGRSESPILPSKKGRSNHQEVINMSEDEDNQVEETLRTAAEQAEISTEL